MKTLILALTLVVSFHAFADEEMSMNEEAPPAAGEVQPTPKAEPGQPELWSCVSKVKDMAGFSDQAAIYICRTSPNKRTASECVKQAKLTLDFNRSATITLCAYTVDTEVYSCAYQALHNGVTDKRSMLTTCQPRAYEIMRRWDIH